MSTAPSSEGLLKSQEQKRGEGTGLSAVKVFRFRVEPGMENEGKGCWREGELGMARGEAWMGEGGKERRVVPRSEAFEETGGRRGTPRVEARERKGGI